MPLKFDKPALMRVFLCLINGLRGMSEYDPFPNQPRLRWEHLTEDERKCVATMLPSEIEDWEMYAGYFVRTDDSVVYVEPTELH